MEKKEVSEEVSGFLEALLQHSQLEVEIECHAEDGMVTVELSGPDSQIVVRDNGSILYAINHILSRAFYPSFGAPQTMIVDCNQYRASRSEELRALAQRSAETVKQSGSLLPLEPMPASERRVVHMALAEEPGVAPESEGIGLNRRVVILPAR